MKSGQIILYLNGNVLHRTTYGSKISRQRLISYWKEFYGIKDNDVWSIGIIPTIPDMAQWRIDRKTKNAETLTA